MSTIQLPANVTVSRITERDLTCSACRSAARYLVVSTTAVVTSHGARGTTLKAAGASTCVRHLELHVRRVAAAVSTTRTLGADNRWTEVPS